MTKPEVFFDTNILLHAFDSDVAKAARAHDLLAIGGIISVQVLNEFANVALADCATLYSEDMNDGQVIDGVKVNNPYRA